MTKLDSDKYVPALGFKWLTPFYDRIIAATTREKRFKSALIEQATVRPHSRILDLACGTGTLAIWIKQEQPQTSIVGVDGDPRVLSLAREKASKKCFDIDFDHAFSHELPYSDRSFDKVISSLFFHHLSRKNKQRTLNEVIRILKPGAELHVADWGAPSNGFMRFLFLFIQLLDGFENTKDNIEGNLMGLFEEAGFIEVKQRNSFDTIFGSMVLYSAIKPS